MEQPKEIWKDIPSSGSYVSYQVSNFGNVISVRKLNSGDCPKMQIKQFHNNKGHCIVQLQTKKRGKSFLVSRLVANAFLPLVEGKPEVRHKNGDVTDNRSVNLAWASHAEVVRHRPLAKITAEDVAQIRVLMCEGKTILEIAEKFGVQRGAIRKIRTGRSWPSRIFNPGARSIPAMTLFPIWLRRRSSVSMRSEGS